MYVLIDTCSWIDLLTEKVENKLLQKINFWIDNKYIDIITHEKIIEEWNKHKKKREKEFASSLKTKYKHANEINKIEGLNTLRNLEPNFDFLKNQVSSIDKILTNATLISTPDIVKSFVADRSIEPRKAPFHNNIASTKDAYIIFSVLNFCEGGKIEKLLFISANKNDFGSPSNLTRSIHPELIEDYKSISVDYYSDIGRAINELSSSFPEPPPKVGDIRQDRINERIDNNIVDRTKPIIIQIYEYITSLFEEINFYPINLLINSYPFKKEGSSYPYYSMFTLSTDNEELFSFFESVKIEKKGELLFSNKDLTKGVRNYTRKTKKVLKALSNNLIFNLENRKTFKRININYSVQEKCNCVRCRFARFDFSGAFKELSIVPKDLDDKFKLAYTHYQIGNFLEAERQFKNLSGISKKRGLNIRNFITQFNLSKLGIFIRNQYWGDNNQDNLVDELRKIDLNKKFTNLSNNENGKLLDWIKSIDFLSESRDKIQNVVAKIRDHYYLQLNGGSSRNNHASELINEYAAIEAFLNQNYIIYDGFNEFHGLTEVFIEGLIVSHSIRDSQSGKLEYIDDWLLKQILIYGKADSILKYARRYNLKEFKYKQTSSEGDSFTELINNFLIGHNKTRRSFKKYCEDDNRYFWDRYNSIFSNLMVMAGLLTLNRNQTNKIADDLLQFLQNEISIQPNNYKHVRFFIVNQSKLIKKSTLKKFLLMSLLNKKTHERGLLETLVEQIKNKFGTIKLAEKDFKSFMTLAFDTCPVCNQKHSSEFIVLLYQIIEDEKKRIRIKEALVKTLNEEYSENLYHMAAIYGILEAKGEFFERLIELSKPASNKVDTQNLFMRKETRYSSLNMLINLCYKYDINSSTRRFIQFKGIYPYYDWLLDMKKFDYAKFNPQWISEYPTKYYLEEMRKHKIITKKVCEYLKNNRDQLVERYSKEIICSDNLN